MWLCKLIVLSFPSFLTLTAPGHLAQCVSQNFLCAHSQHSIFFTFTVGNRLAPFLLPHLVWMAKYNLLEAAGLEGSPLGAHPNYPGSSTLMAPVAASQPEWLGLLAEPKFCFLPICPLLSSLSTCFLLLLTFFAFVPHPSLIYLALSIPLSLSRHTGNSQRGFIREGCYTCASPGCLGHPTPPRLSGRLRFQNPVLVAKPFFRTYPYTLTVLLLLL